MRGKELALATTAKRTDQAKWFVGQLSGCETNNPAEHHTEACNVAKEEEISYLRRPSANLIGVTFSR
jgi:hypothetical protein